MKLGRWCTVFLAVGVTVWYGCNGGKQAKNDGAGVGSGAPVVSDVKYTVSEKDAFHPNSQVESIRKKTLTNFGIFKGEMPPATPDADAASALIAQPGMDSAIRVVYMINFNPRKTSFPFDYENDIASLKRLYAMHNLSTVVRDDATDMENLTALAKYTHTFLEGGSVPSGGEESGPSAFDITQKRREKNIGGGSGVHSALFVQLALSCGFTARIVSMHTFDDAGRPLPYDVAEVYVDQFRKWVVFDTFSRVTYYLKDMRPLSALEIHTMVAGNRLREISPVSAIGDPMDFVSVRERLLPRYRFIYLWRMNNFLGLGNSWAALYPSHLVWEDRDTLVPNGGFEKLPRFAGGVKYVTHTRDDFDWDVNYAQMTIYKPKDNDVTICLDTLTPNFRYFEMLAGFEKERSNGVFVWSGSFDNTTFNSVNALDRKGYSSILVFSAQ